MWVALLYIGSSGDMVRKSALMGSTFLHLALVSIIFNVEKRLLSRSNANSWGKVRDATSPHETVCRTSIESHLPLVFHQGA